MLSVETLLYLSIFNENEMKIKLLKHNHYNQALLITHYKNNRNYDSRTRHNLRTRSFDEIVELVVGFIGTIGVVLVSFDCSSSPDHRDTS